MSTVDVFDVQPAKSYVLIGLIFYILGAAAFTLSYLGSSLFMGGFIGPGMMSGYMTPYFPSVFPIIQIVFTVWAWMTLSNINAGKYRDAQTASLILGIFGLVFAWLIGGIFFLLAYGKLGDAIRYQHLSTAAAGPPSPAATTPPAETGVFCPKCGKPSSEDAVYCKNCGQRLK